MIKQSTLPMKNKEFVSMPAYGRMRGIAQSAVVFAALLAAGPAAHAQSSVLERNIPEAPVSEPGAIRVDQAISGSTDETPLGVTVSGITLIGQGADIPAAPRPGVRLEGLDESYADELQSALAPFLGQPLSQALITRAQSAVAGVWRTAGYPFMSVTTPPQEVTSGVLTLRVVEFTAGTISLEDQARTDELAPHIRLQTGGRISAPQLSEDLAWLNRNPFREVGAVFAPGDQRGASDVTLTVTEQRPVSVYASWNDTGSASTGRDRWFVGGGAWIPALNDMTLALRFTRSHEIWNGGEVFSLDRNRAGYLSIAGRIDLPTWPRQALSIAPNLVITNELVAGTPFSFENTTFELPIYYHSAVSNILHGRHWGDIYGGVEPKWLSRQTRFDGIDVVDADIGLVNLVAGWSHQFLDPYGRSGIDLRLKGNPGGIVGNNTAADWADFTGGRVTDHTYLHAGLDITRVTALPHAFTWFGTLSGQFADQALPDTERLNLGGYYAVRGYEGGDVATDAGFFWRNELRLPSLSPLAAAGLADSFSPFAFLDFGWGRDIAADKDATLGGAGLGLDYALAGRLNAAATAAVALSDAGTTRSNDWSVNAQIRLTY